MLIFMIKILITALFCRIISMLKMYWDKFLLQEIFKKPTFLSF
jgi:hypothetical protein